MARRAATFNIVDLRRAIRIAREEGLSIGAVEIRENSLFVRIGEPMACDQETGDPTLDNLFKEVAKGKHGARREAN